MIIDAASLGLQAGRGDACAPGRAADRATPTAAWQAEVAIVGAGPAGITLALQLAARGHDVLLLESGGEGSSRPRTG